MSELPTNINWKHPQSDITGKRFGRLRAVSLIGIKWHAFVWQCICDCGTTKVISGSNLRLGRTISCGCAKPKRTIPEREYDRLYRLSNLDKFRRSNKAYRQRVLERNKIFRRASREDWKRFWSKVWKTETCWLWLGKHNDQGRALFSCGGDSNIFAARWLQEQIRGEKLTRKIEVCHRCDNPGCVKLRDCFLGSHRDNMIDAAAKGRIKGRQRKQPVTPERLDCK